MTKKQRYIIGSIIVTLAIFLRFFNLGDWMHYELDQARDFRIINAAIEYGPGELTLQGPKAAGSVMLPDENGALTDKTTLRLGPLFYYIEYVSARIFGATPLGSIILITILSIVTVPLLFFFARRFFGVPLAFGLSAIIASSLFFVTYSRFGWNPNLLPFFMLLLAYSLLRVTDMRDRERGVFLIVAALALAFVGQLHFLAFIAAPIISIIYLVWSWRTVTGKNSISLKFWFVAVIVFFLLQTPLIINDIKTNGENARAFIAATTQKTQDDNPKSLLEKIVKNTGTHAKYYWIIMTGDQRAELPTIRGRDVKCDHNCRTGMFRGVVSLLIIIVSFIAWVFLYYREKDLTKRNFLRLVVIWESVIFMLYIPLAYEMSPRFFLLHAPVMIIFFGFFLHVLFTQKNQYGKIIGWSIISLSVISNLIFVTKDFSERAQAATNQKLHIETDYIMKEKTRITFEQIMIIVQEIQTIHNKNNNPVWIYAQSEFKRSFVERVGSEGMPQITAPKDLYKAYENVNYFVILRTQSRQETYLEKLLKNADIVSIKTYGTLTLFQLQPKEHVIIDDVPIISEPVRDPRRDRNSQYRYLWRQIFE